MTAALYTGTDMETCMETHTATDRMEITETRMRLIDIDVRPTCRVVWVSDEARETWSDPLRRVSALVGRLEIESVARGHRPASWQTISGTEFLSFSQSAAARGLSVLPIKRVQTWEGFAHKHVPAAANDPAASICVVVAQDIEAALEFKSAHERGDNDRQGELLGYPQCDREFFSQVWAAGYFDPVWQAAKHSQYRTVESGPRRIRVTAHPYSNPLLRYAGIRVGFHIPHSFFCAETVAVAERRMELAREVDPDMARLLEAFLRMPCSWDAYHGIAVVRTPIFYLIVNSVPCAERHVVEIEGSFIPQEGARGLIFPFNEGGENR